MTNVYPFHDTCIVEALVDGDLVVGTSFWTMANVDLLHIGTKKFSGTHGPDGISVAAGSRLQWDALSQQAWIDSRTEHFGFDVCYETTPAPSATPSPSLSALPTLEPTPLSDRFFALHAGSCQVAGLCFSSTNFGRGDYPADDKCNATTLQAGTLRVAAFSTEFAYDLLLVDGVPYSGPSGGPDGVALAAGAKLNWRADSFVEDSGFEVCFEGAPSPAPTPQCGPGTFSDPGLGFACSRCPAGTFSTSDGSAPFPTACEPCPAGTYNSEVGHGGSISALVCETVCIYWGFIGAIL